MKVFAQSVKSVPQIPLMPWAQSAMSRLVGDIGGAPMDPKFLVRDEATLLDLYGHGSPASLVKEVDHVHAHYRAFIEASSFVILATNNSEGMDASPRGDPAGFVVVEDERTFSDTRPSWQQPGGHAPQSGSGSENRPVVSHPGRLRVAAGEWYRRDIG